MPPTFKLMECTVVNIIVGFGETLELRRHLIQHANFLDMVFRSLLRKVVVRGEIVEDAGENEQIRLFNTKTLIELTSNVAYIICK